MPSRGSVSCWARCSSMAAGGALWSVLSSPEVRTPLDIRRNSEDCPAPTPRELAPQFEWLAPNAEPSCDPNHPLTLLLGDEFFTARGTSEPLFHERVAFDFGGDVVDRD